MINMITKQQLKEVRKSIGEIEKLFEDYQNSMLFILDEQTSETEEHCTCVPILKIKINELEQEVADLKQRIMWRDGKITRLSDWARELPEPYITEFFNLLANGTKYP